MAPSGTKIVATRSPRYNMSLPITSIGQLAQNVRATIDLTNFMCQPG